MEDGGNFELSYSSVTEFFGGLEGLNGSPDPKLREAMEREHLHRVDSEKPFTTGNYGITTTPKTEWNFAVGGPVPPGGWPQETKNCSVAHRRSPATLEWLQQQMASLNAPLAVAHETALLEEEVIGLRLYTGPMFEKCLDFDACSGLAAHF